MTRERASRIAVGLIALFMLPAGLQAAFAPRSFFEDFPFGRGWISAGGDAFNEHLVRDVGSLFLALIVVTAWTVWRRADVTGVALGWLVFGLLHLTYHVGHLDALGTADAVGLTITLVAVPALAAFAVVAGGRFSRR